MFNWIKRNIDSFKKGYRSKVYPHELTRGLWIVFGNLIESEMALLKDIIDEHDSATTLDVTKTDDEGCILLIDAIINVPQFKKYINNKLTDYLQLKKKWKISKFKPKLRREI